MGVVNAPLLPADDDEARCVYSHPVVPQFSRLSEVSLCCLLIGMGQ